MLVYFFDGNKLNELKGIKRIKLIIENKKSFLIKFSIIFLIMICVQISWETRLKMIGMPAGQSITSVAPKILWEQDFSSNKIETINRFFEILFFQQIAKSEISYKYNEFSYNIKDKYEEKYRLSYIGYLFLLFGSIFWFYFAGGRKKNVLITVYFGFILTSIGYILIILGVYLYVFQRSDLPSMIRYVNSVTLPTFLLTFLIFFPVLEKLRREIKERKLDTIIVAILVFALIERPYLKPLYKSFPKIRSK